MTRKVPIHLLSKQILDLDNETIEIIFDLPNINLPSNSKLSVASLWIGWKKSPVKARTFDATLSCSLIDFEINNFDQTILFFSDKTSRSTSVSPTHFIDYIIRSSSLNSAVFKIKFCIPVERDRVREIKEKSKLTSSNIEKIRLLLLLDAGF